MAKLPQISGERLVKAFKKGGWLVVSQKGSHVKMIKMLKPVGKATVIIPQHKVVKKGTLLRILKDTSTSVEKLKSLL